jgi:phosphomannomutase
MNPSTTVNPAATTGDTPAQVSAQRFAAIFKAYDVRGLCPQEFDVPMAKAIGAAFAKFADSARIVVARDMRQTGVELVAAFTEGANSEGVDVIDIGLASTDLLYFASGHLNLPGVTFTASHNPAQYNGIKMCLAGAKPIGEDSGLRVIRDSAAALIAGDAAWSTKTGTRTELTLLDEFAAHCLSFIDVSKVRKLKIVADTANGMGGLVVPVVFDRLGVEYEILYPELDGTFPNHPADPIQPENLRDLQARVLAVGADVGLAFDGDADRVFLVDEKGKPVSGSLTTAMVAAAILDKQPGSSVVHNLICSKAVAETVTEHNGVPIRTRVGHSFIKQVMADTGAVFGGEHSGHYYFRENWRADSGMIAALHIIELLSVAGESTSLSKLRKPFERYIGSGEINTKVASPAVVMQRIENAYSEKGATIDHLDGLTVDLGTWWFNLRPSNTEPLLRLNLEASSQSDCEAHVAEVLTLVTGLATAKG